MHTAHCRTLADFGSAGKDVDGSWEPVGPELRQPILLTKRQALGPDLFSLDSGVNLSHESNLIRQKKRSQRHAAPPRTFQQMM